MYNKFFIFLVFLLISKLCFAQNFPLSNNYQFNKFDLSPAYAGFNGNNEVFLSIAKSWWNFEGAPESQQLSFQGSFLKNSGYGLSVNRFSLGVFNYLTSYLTYAYKINLSKNQTINFAVSAEMSRNSINYSTLSQHDILDPVLTENNINELTIFDANAALLYSYKKFNLSLSSFKLLEAKSNVNSYKRNFKSHISYSFNLKQVILEPIIIIIYQPDRPLLYEGSCLAEYRESYWMGAAYSSSGDIKFLIGFNFLKKFITNYSYILSTGEINKGSLGTHGISFGFLIGDNKYTGQSRASSFNSKASYSNIYD